jgi:hypothetical protein
MLDSSSPEVSVFRLPKAVLHKHRPSLFGDLAPTLAYDFVPIWAGRLGTY